MHFICTCENKVCLNQGIVHWKDKQRSQFGEIEQSYTIRYDLIFNLGLQVAKKEIEEHLDEYSLLLVK